MASSNIRYEFTRKIPTVLQRPPCNRPKYLGNIDPEKTEIGPTIDLRPLIRLQNEAKMATDSLKSQLSLEVVRPETYAALRKHLQGVTSKHGKGYYHLVHLDMHGALRSVSASRYCRLFENWACFHEFQ